MRKKNKEKETICVSTKDFRNERIFRIAILLGLNFWVYLIFMFFATDPQWDVSVYSWPVLIPVIQALDVLYSLIGLLYIKHKRRIIKPVKKVKKEVVELALGAALNFITFVLVVFMSRSTDIGQQKTMAIISMICIVLALVLYESSSFDNRSRWEYVIDEEPIHS